MIEARDFEARLGDAVKALAANADRPFDPAQIAARAAGSSLRISRLSRPRTLSRRVLAFAIATTPIAVVIVLAYALSASDRGVIVGPPLPSSTPVVVATPHSSVRAEPSGVTATPHPRVLSEPRLPRAWEGLELPARPDSQPRPAATMRHDAVEGGFTFDDNCPECPTVSPYWADITSVRWHRPSTWTIELGERPPDSDGVATSGGIIEYGLVFDTNDDGAADYVVGINNDIEQSPEFAVWVTDIAAGTTSEQIGPPYGFPIDFHHPDEFQPGDEPSRANTVSLFFLPDTRPSGLDATARFYAFISVSIGDRVVLSDYAPNSAWLEPDTP